MSDVATEFSNIIPIVQSLPKTDLAQPAQYIENDASACLVNNLPTLTIEPIQTQPENPHDLLDAIEKHIQDFGADVGGVISDLVIRIRKVL